MATIKDLANRYGLEDYEQLLGGYPNATKFVNALQSNIESHIPTTEDLQSPERMGEWSLAAALNQPTGLAIKGYHGSPHKFKEFDTAHMGSGEGGQAYGWGNYITEDPYVATTYSPQDEWMDEQLMNLYNQAERRQDYPSMEVYERYMMHERPNEVKDYLKESYADYPEDLPKRLPAQKIGENLYKKQKGSHLYEVSMEFPKEREAVDPMSIEHFLDYDKPLSEQSDYVRNILQSHDPDMYHPEGPDYDPAEKGSSILSRFGSGKEGAQKLYELGIPGTTYMGEKAKVANPEGVRNFVTYSDEVPRVVTRNMNKVKPLTDEDRLNDLEKQMSAYMKTKRMPKGVDFKTGSDWYDWAYDKRAKLRGYAKGGIVDKLKSQDFGPDDSVIVSSLMHPSEAAGKAGDWLQEKMRIASGRPYEDNFTPDQQAQAGLDLAGLMQTGAMPFAPASAGGTLGTFIGPKSRNWDKVAAELAAKKLDEGADPAEVWREHLIGRMPDKTLFSEISDKDALYHEHGKDFYDSTLNKTNQLLKHGRDTAEYPLNVQDMLAHPNFYENYPNLEATELRYLPETSTSKGAFGYFADNGDPVLNIHGMLPNNEAKSTMLHELQHGIQRDEGWGQGGSPQEFTRQKEAEHARDVLNWRNEVLARKKKYPDTDTNAIENNIIKDYIDMGLFNDFVPSREARELATQPYMMYPERYDHTNEFEKLNNLIGEYGLDKRTTPYTPIEGYKRLTGEAQARATQDRLDMDMAQRRENYPLAGGKLSDIPLEELIYKYAQGGSVDKDSLQLNKPQRTPNHPTKSHIVKTMVDGKEKIIRFGEQGAETAGKPKEGESDRMTAKRESFKARHAKNIAKGPSSAAYWADKVKWAEGGSVSMEDLPFDDPDQLRLYHQAMKHYDDVIENTGGSKKMGKTEARINYNTITKGDRDRDKDLHTLIADYGIDVGKDAKINATMIKPMEAEGVYLGNLTGSVPVGEGRASLGLQGLHTKYSDGLSGYTAGYSGKVGDGDLSASYFEPADHNSAGRQVQLEYSMPFADGGSVSEFEDPAHERLYRRAMAHFDDMSAKQNFEDNDSMIASTILHPVEAAKRAGSAFMRSVDTAGGRPKQALDESSWYPVGIEPSRDEQAQAAFDLAGLAQTGAMPFAPSTGAGVLGTITIPKKRITVTDPERSAFPDIYDRPDEIARRAAQNVAEEDPAMKRLFGVNRDDLYEIRKARAEGNESPAIVMPAKPKGAKVGPQVTNRRNANRIIDTLSEAMNYPDLYKGMTSWYENGPIYDRLAQISDTPIEDFKKFQTYTGMASPGSDVLTELNRGTAALTLANQGRLDDFIKYGGRAFNTRNNDFPEDLYGVKGHVYHSTAHANPMKKYYESGEIQMDSPKVPLYIQSSGVPETGYQTEYPVGDAHWSRAVGLGDVRTSKGYDASVSTPELLSLAPWWKGLSKKLGLNSVDSQALAWGTFAPATGVTTPVGASKLELLSRKIMEAAKAYNITPEEARDMILTGKMYAPDIGMLEMSKKYHSK